MQPAVFADTFYWLALARPRDAWHGQALAWASIHRATHVAANADAAPLTREGAQDFGR